MLDLVRLYKSYGQEKSPNFFGSIGKDVILL
jgi:hypothetical protein